MGVMEESKNKLWTKNFTIITLGTVVSLMGNAISGFAISIMVLDYTNSTFLYALYMVVYNLPKIFMPMAAGPYLDNFSRKKVIYGLDFLSSGLYLGIYFMLRNGFFSYGPFLAVVFLIGSIDSIYQVAYDSLYPTLITEGNYRKAYSISSLIQPLSLVMVPVAAILYEKINLEIFFICNAVTFFIAAVFETQIRSDESQVKKNGEVLTLSEFKQQFKDGLSYISGEKGLLIITAYFFVTMFASGASSTIVLPYFKANMSQGALLYTFVIGCSVAGRAIGGAFQYKYSYKADKKFIMSLFVYFAVTILEGSFLFFPLIVMAAMNLISGILSVTSYNIRVAGTQSYVPNTYRGRFNGAFQMICTLGTISGQLLSGALADMIEGRIVLASFMAVNFVAILLIMVPGRNHVKPIYNREL